MAYKFPPAAPGAEFFVISALVCFTLVPDASAADATTSASPSTTFPGNIRVLAKTHTMITANDLSGPGSTVAGLANTFDMSLFESNWGGKQATFQGAGITTNTSYPLTEGEAITTQDQLGLAAGPAKDVEVGFLWQLYAAGGNRGVGRTYGVSLPWDDFERQDGRVVPNRVASELYRAWVRDAKGPLTYAVTAGSLEDLDLTRRDWNFLKLGSLLYRPPVTTAGVFGKSDQRWLPPRHPLRGAEGVVDMAWDTGVRVHGNVFGGRTKPTPVQEIDRDAIGTRWGLTVYDASVGATYVRTEGERNPVITGERQTLWALDGSYHLVEWLDLFGAWAWSEYHRDGRLDGSAWVGGVRIAGPAKSEWRAQYQRLDENYELMGYRKIEHYPANFHGVQASVVVPAAQGSIKGLVYRLHQLETNTRPGDAIFGDAYFPAIAGSGRGDITVWRLGGEYDLQAHRSGWPALATYVEQALFQKDAPDTAANDIDKTVTNWSIGISQPLLKQLTAEMSYRLVTASGRWQSMRFHHRQGIPEARLCYRVTEGGVDRLRVTALYHYYDFVDSLPGSGGRNNYQAHQMVLEVSWTF